MNPFHRTVLSILSQSDEAVGWYYIERRLSNMALDERPYLPAVLDELKARGWIVEVSATDEPKVRYLVTTLGREALGRRLN